MVASVQSPTDVANLSLAMLGYPRRIGSLYEGSEAAKRILDVYAETRDEVLRSKDWPFALRQVNGTPTYPPFNEWAYGWIYPTDCIRLRSVAPALLFSTPDLDPQPLLWTIMNNQSATPPQKVIMTQVSPIVLFYVGQITDMTTWEPLFVNAVAQAIADKVGPALRKDMAPRLSPEAAVAIAATASELLPPDDTAAPPQEAQRRAQR